MRRGLLTMAVMAGLMAAPAHAQVPVPPLGGGSGGGGGGGGGSSSSSSQQQQQPAPQQPPAQQRQAPNPVQLSNERTLTRWAGALDRVRVRTRPASNAAVVTRLRWDTEDGFPEIYIALERFTDANGRQWIRVRLPMRPNGRTGWVPRSALGSLHTVTTFLRVDRRRFTATLYRRGKRIFHARVGVGRPGMPTPPGHFWVRERLRVTTPGSLYGPLAFGTSAYSRLTDWPGGGVVGIHGTNEPKLIPGRPSHGCIRMRNRDILRLGRLMPLGTPIAIV